MGIDLMTDHLINIDTVLGQKVGNGLRLYLQLGLTGNERVNKLLSELLIKKLVAEFNYLLKRVNSQALVCLQSDDLRLGEPQLGRDFLTTNGLCRTAPSLLHRQPIEELVFVLFLGKVVLDQGYFDIHDRGDHLAK